MRYIAHRGLSSQAPENTLSAFLLAAKTAHYFGIECDVQTTKDHQFVVFHDDELSRMTGHVAAIKDLNYDELESVLIQSGENLQVYPNKSIPLLTEFLDICSTYDKTAVIELKHVHDISLLIEFMNILDFFPSLPKIVISFNISYLKYLRALTDIPLQLLSERINNELIYDARVNKLDLSLEYHCITSNAISQLKKEGFLIGAWTVTHEEDAKKLEKLGVDFLTTDRL
ncbi:MAG: hypothetical protein IH571_06780 [Acholeplasmataceae bacterium]|nr:hypothetical protein [Acholeplasmataceae bacterium]